MYDENAFFFHEIESGYRYAQQGLILTGGDTTVYFFLILQKGKETHSIIIHQEGRYIIDKVQGRLVEHRGWRSIIITIGDSSCTTIPIRNEIGCFYIHFCSQKQQKKRNSNSNLSTTQTANQQSVTIALFLLWRA